MEKFISLMETSELYFCRADYFRKADPFEGTYPKVEYNFFSKRFGQNVARKSFEILSKNTFLNCWHLNDNENLAMWKLYSKNDKGIALQTDIQSFKDSFENSDRPIYSGKVQYIDYEKDYYYGRSGHNYTSANGFTDYIHKRIIYDFEKEYRAICTDPSGKERNGLKVKVTLDKLIHNIFLAPNTSNKSLEHVAKLTSSISKNIKIMRSSFDSTPYY